MKEIAKILWKKCLIRSSKHFIQTCFSLTQEFSYRFNPHGALKNFIEDMRSRGRCEFKYTPTKEVRDKFGLTETSYVFEKHADLDELATKLFEHPEFKTKHKYDYSLLKAFDRAFWARHLKDPNNLKYEAKQQGLGSECPFGDPTVSQSYCMSKQRKVVKV